MCSILTKGSTCRKNTKNEIFLDLNRTGHDKSVKKKLTFWHKYLRSYGRFTNYIVLLIMINIYIIIKKKIVYSLDLKKKGYSMMQNIFTNIKCSEIILYNANENWYIILYGLFSRLCYIATCGPFCKDATHIVNQHDTNCISR